LIWGALLAGLAVLVVDQRRRTGALVLSYFLILSLGHVPGVLPYLVPNIFESKVEATKIGFDMTLIGMVAFTAGAIAARILPIRSTGATSVQSTFSHEALPLMSWRVLMLGIASYFLFLPVSGFVPSLTAVTSVMGELLIIGLWFRIYTLATTKRSRRISLVLVMLPVLPLSTLVSGGFIGYGTTWVLSITAFYFVIARRRIWFYLATPPVIFLGLSLFVTYFQQRDDIRDVIWYQNAGIERRLAQVSKLVTEFQFLDLSDEFQQFALDGRLNQNFLVGMGVMAHRQGQSQLWYGGTVPLWAIIPRAIWPDKPTVGGSGGLVSEFTGITFEKDTSVGVGQVLEFYMNFGMAGVLAGFAIFGFVLMRLDQGLMRGLAMGNIHGAVQCALLGLALLQPLGSLLEIIVGAVSAIVVAQLLFRSQLLVSTQRPNSKMPGRTTRMVVRR
jgi:hypothetical protein